MSDHDALLRAVCGSPDDDAPRLVFADWLEEYGDAERAEFIRLQIKLATSKSSAQELDRESELLKRHKREWTGPIREFEAQETGDLSIFRRGFVEGISSCGKIMIEQGDRLFSVAPIREVRFGSLPSDISEYLRLAKCEWLIRLHTLDLPGLSRYFAPAPLIQSPYLANLETLRLAGGEYLDMDGIRALIATEHLTRLKTLDFSGNWLDEYDERGAFALFLTANNLPWLRNLSLAFTGLGNDGAIALAATPWVAQLKVLDLSANSIGDRGCRAIAESPHFEMVEILDLQHNDGETTPETMQLLVERFGARVLL